MKNITSISAIIFSLFILAQPSFAEDASAQIESIISKDEAPAGVVFEIVTGSANALAWALPATQGHIKTLRKYFPKLEVAIVTHGNEQFALQKSKDKKYKKIHSLTKQLTQVDNVPLHVCGTYAGWRGVTEEDFPDYVDVAPAGPATINDYLALDYILIKI